MNADGSRDIAVEVTAGASVPALGRLVGALLILAACGLVVAIALLVAALRRAGSGPTLATPDERRAP